MCNKGTLICRGKTLLTRNRHFSLSPRVIVTRISIRGLHSRHHAGSACIGTRHGVGCSILNKRFGVHGVSTSPARGRHRFILRHRIGPRPFVPADDSVGTSYRRVFGVRLVNLTGHVMRARTGAIMINVDNKLSSALTLLIYIGTFSGLGVSHQNVINIAVPNFKAASEACGGTVSLVGDLNVAVERVDVTGTIARRFRSVNRSTDIRSMACRGSRTHRHARVLVSLTGGVNNVIVNANSLSRLTLN